MIRENYLKKLICVILSMVMSVGLFPAASLPAAEDLCVTYSGENTEAQTYSTYSTPVYSYLTPCSDGKIMLVQYGKNNDGNVLVEYYDEDYSLQSYKMIPEELPIFGGFYASENYYFIVTGQENTEQSAEVEAYRITKYDKNWNRVGSVGLKDCNTTVPFDFGSLRMTESGKYLLIRTSHEMYSGHQSNVTIEVDTENMEIADSYTITSNSDYGYVSHSFNQFIKIEDNKIVALDHGDSYPRSIVLLNYKTDVTTGKFVPEYNNRCSAINVMCFPGAVGNNTTGASVGGFEISDSSYLVAGNSVVQDESSTGRNTRNIFVASVNKETSAVTTNWLTAFEEGEESASTPQLVKVSDNKFVILWSRGEKFYYALLDGNGNKISNIYSGKGNLSDCLPIVANDKIVWYTWRDEVITFYEITLDNISSVNINTTNNGHEYVFQGVDNGVASHVCAKCHEEKTVAVPESFDRWWGSAEYGTFSSGVDTNQQSGNQVYLWADVAEENVNKEIVYSSSDSSVVDVVKLRDDRALLIMKKSGTATVTVSSKWNPECSYEMVFYVEGPSLCVSEGVEINGYQISTAVGGSRTIYSVEKTINELEVVEQGLVYGLGMYVTEDDIYVGADSKYVVSFAATNAGVLSTNAGSATARSYAMTMVQNIGKCIPEGLSAKYYVRAYAKLSDGSYVYSEAGEYSVYSVSDYLYQNNEMNSKDGHDYLYNNILKIVDQGYKEVEFISAID